MKKISFIERKSDGFFSIENVFREIARSLSSQRFETTFQQLGFGNRLGGIVMNLLLFRPRSADIFHVTGHAHYVALLLPADRTVLTVHDLRFMFMRTGVRRFLLKKLFLDWPIKKVKYITAISLATRDEIVRFTGCPAEKIRVIENPLQKCLVSGNKGPFREKCPTILQVGTMPNKNILNLAYALRGVNCRLRIVGKLDEGQTDILRECSISYKNDVNISDEEMKNAYEDADIVAFCSTYEGFGLPIIEAQASRTPVVTSDISPLREVAGGAACLVDPTDPLAIRDGIRKVISCATYRQELVERGVVNVKRFDSRLIAAAYERLYDEILANIA